METRCALLGVGAAAPDDPFERVRQEAGVDERLQGGKRGVLEAGVSGSKGSPEDAGGQKRYARIPQSIRGSEEPVPQGRLFLRLHPVEHHRVELRGRREQAGTAQDERGTGAALYGEGPSVLIEPSQEARPLLRLGRLRAECYGEHAQDRQDDRMGPSTRTSRWKASGTRLNGATA